MSKRAEEAALKAYPEQLNMVAGPYPCEPFTTDTNAVLRKAHKEGYEQAEKDTVDRAAEWWYEHMAGFMSEGLAKNVIEEFREAMADGDTRTTKGR